MPEVDLFAIIDELKTAAPEWAERIETAMDEGKAIHVIEAPCPKVKYGHEETALEAAKAMHSKTGDGYDAYQCPYPPCRAWHIGHSKAEYIGEE